MTTDPNQPPRRLQVRGRAGVWEVLRDDRFYGHYMGHQAAFAAAEAAALAIVSKGGAADLYFREQPQAGAAQPAQDSGTRTMEFRPGSTPVVR
jgi:hypothetical protein